MSYMENMGKVLQAYSKKAFEYGDAKAWDNRKGKAWKRCTPTGKVYRRLMRQEWQAATLPLFEAVKNLEALQVTANSV